MDACLKASWQETLERFTVLHRYAEPPLPWPLAIFRRIFTLSCMWRMSAERWYQGVRCVKLSAGKTCWYIIIALEEITTRSRSEFPVFWSHAFVLLLWSLHHLSSSSFPSPPLSLPRPPWKVTGARRIWSHFICQWARQLSLFMNSLRRGPGAPRVSGKRTGTIPAEPSSKTSAERLSWKTAGHVCVCVYVYACACTVLSAAFHGGMTGAKPCHGLCDLNLFWSPVRFLILFGHVVFYTTVCPRLQEHQPFRNLNEDHIIFLEVDPDADSQERLLQWRHRIFETLRIHSTPSWSLFTRSARMQSRRGDDRSASGTVGVQTRAVTAPLTIVHQFRSWPLVQPLHCA